MKTPLILSILLVLGIYNFVGAQEPDTLMKLVLENNRQLKAAREAYHVAILKAGTGNTPPDPEVEFGYLYGKPEDLGNRVDFGVTQQLDFPTAYFQRSKIKKILNSRAELEYVLARQEVMLEARQLWIKQVHLNQLRSLLEERLQQAEAIQKHAEQKLEAGEVGLLELSQSKLLLASLSGEYEEMLSQTAYNRLALKEITGGVALEISDTLLPQAALMIADTMIEAYRMSPYTQYYHHGLEMKEEEKKLAVSQHLPKLSAGYYSETVTNVAFRGFRLGLTVPLWEKANTVNKAKSEIAFAEAELEHNTFQQEKEVLQKLNQLESLRSRADQLEEALGTANTLSLLATSLENGEISYSEYFYSSDFYFRNQQLLLRYKKELLLQEADLMKIYL